MKLLEKFCLLDFCNFHVGLDILVAKLGGGGLLNYSGLGLALTFHFEVLQLILTIISSEEELLPLVVRHLSLLALGHLVVCTLF